MWPTARSLCRALLLNSRSDVPLRLQVAHYLSKGGFDAADKRSIRAVSLLAHKFIMDVADEAMQITSRRSSSRVAAGAAAAPAGLLPPPCSHCSHSTSLCPVASSFVIFASAIGGKDEKQTLTIDVLMHALRQKGVNIYKPSIIKARPATARDTYLS